jgi:glutamate synthase domain-containing protein 3
MVDLDALVDDEDCQTVKTLLANHVRFTKSSVAKDILDNWEYYQSKFVKIMPTDYKRVLAAIKKARETGISEDEAVMEAAHG